jgi:lactate dehydrogenase-like 2-hydroxyacid dehydrogenase
LSRPKILLTRQMPEAVEGRLAAAYDLAVNPHDRLMTIDELRAAWREHDALCPNSTDRLDASLFAGPGRVSVVANYGAGIEHIDLEAARRGGIPVTNTPGAVTEPTADLAVMLMLMAMRHAGAGERELRAGLWTGWRPGHLVGQSLSGKLLGLVGFGRIGRATAERARAFGLRIAYYSRRRVAPELEAPTGARHCPSLDELVAEADVLSLHCPGGAETRHLIDAARLARMKPTAVLVNTARGSVVDEGALAEALAGGRLYAAGLDVYEREPTVAPGLLELENVVLLPHMGSATLEARTRMGMQMAENLDAFFAGAPLPDLAT